MSSPLRRLGEITWPEVEEMAAANAVVFLPVGSTEAHGPHLPLATDVIIARETIARAARELPVPSLEAPALSYAVTEYAREFPGTITLRTEAAQATARDICEGLLAHGFRHIVIVNGHVEPAHVHGWRDVVAEINAVHGSVACFPDNTRRRWVATLSEEFQKGDAHAGQYETSLVLAARPELVAESARDLEPRWLDLVGQMKAGHQTFQQMGADEGYFGNPAQASAEHGEQQYRALVHMVLTEIRETFGIEP